MKKVLLALAVLAGGMVVTSEASAFGGLFGLRARNQIVINNGFGRDRVVIRDRFGGFNRQQIILRNRGFNRFDRFNSFNRFDNFGRPRIIIRQRGFGGFGCF